MSVSSGHAAERPGVPAKVSAWNVANALTVGRIAMVPVFVVVLMSHGGTDARWRWAATVVFALAAVTDRLDGHLARSRGLITDFGKIADPIADKALVGAALVCLSTLGELPWWVTIVIGVREIGVTVWRLAVLQRAVVPASRGGKVKTVVQVVAIGVALMPYGHLPAWQTVCTVLMAAALVLSVATGVDYLVQAVRLNRRRPEVRVTDPEA